MQVKIGGTENGDPLSQALQDKDKLSMWQENIEANSIEGSIEDKFAEYIEHPKSMALPQSTIYNIILRTVYNTDHNPIKWPKGFKSRLVYILFVPLTHLQYISIPNPMGHEMENFYPLSLFMASIWIWIYTFFIVWWTYTVT